MENKTNITFFLHRLQTRCRNMVVVRGVGEDLIPFEGNLVVLWEEFYSGPMNTGKNKERQEW